MKWTGKLDSVLRDLAPGWALKREKAREEYDRLQNMRAVRRALNSGYSHHGANRQKASMVAWTSTSKSPDEDIVSNLELLRERSRDEYYGTPLARGAIDRIVTSSIGPGLKPKCSIGWEYLGMSEEEADEWEKITEREFGYWAESKLCDWTGRNTFYEMQGLVFLSVLMNGDAFAMLPVKRSPDRLYDLRVRLLEGDRVCTPDSKPAGAIITGGVELDPGGAPSFFWVANRHPKSELVSGRLEWQRIPVWGSASGRRNIIQLMRQERIDQARGVPLLAPVLEVLKQLGRYTYAELMAAVVSGYYSVFFEHDIKESDDELGEESLADAGEEYDGGSGIEGVQLGYGSVVDLPPGTKAQTASPGRPNQSFDAFVLAICRQVGSALGIPYELLVLNFTSSYSASRGALLEAWKLFKIWREWMGVNFCQPIYYEWLCEAVLKGRVIAPGFFDDPMRAYCYSWTEWYGPAQGQLDPAAEVKAARGRIEINASSEAKEAMELTGSEWDSIVRQRAKEERVKKELGLPAFSAEGNEGTDVLSEGSEDAVEDGGTGREDDDV